jgi:catechol 2,3-dioxygenase
LRVADLDRALLFYQGKLGFRLRAQHEQTAYLSATGEEPDHLRLTERPGAKPKPRRTTGLFHAAIRLPSRKALADVLLRLLRQHVEPQGFSDHGVSEAIYLSDPDGNGLELYADRPRSEWAHRAGQVVMVTEPLDMNGLLAHVTDEAGATGLDPKTDIGHVHLQVADLAKTEEFYHGQLGFEVTQRSYPGALFFAAAGYHHHIGANIWAGRSLPRPPEDAAGLMAFSVVAPNVGDRASHRVVEDPDGNRIELITDSRPEAGPNREIANTD